MPFRSPAGAARAGVAFVSNDRKSEGLFLDKPIAANLIATRLPSLARAGMISPAARARRPARWPNSPASPIAA